MAAAATHGLTLSCVAALPSQSRKQSLEDAYGEPENFLEIDVINVQVHGLGRQRYADFEIRMKVREPVVDVVPRHATRWPCARTRALPPPVPPGGGGIVCRCVCVAVVRLDAWCGCGCYWGYPPCVRVWQASPLVVVHVLGGW